MTISGTSHRVDHATSPTFSGVVTDDEGDTLAGVRVALVRLEEGAWRKVVSGVTDEDGQVTLSAPPVYENTVLRLRTKGARSDRWRVRVHPELTLSPTVDGSTVTIVATASGGHPGDVVSLVGRRDGRRVTLATGILDSAGAVTFSVEQETRKSRYVARLAPSDRHTADRTILVVTRPKAPDGGEETPPPPT